MTQRFLTMITLAAAATACIVGTSNAAFLYLWVEHEWVRWSDLAVAKVYARFDSSTDRLLGIPQAYITANGSFYQNLFGTETEPNPLYYPVDPTVAYDTFVTVGLDSIAPGQPTTQLARGADFADNSFEGGWSTEADAPQGLPQPLPGSGGHYVLIGQFTLPWSGSVFEPLPEVAGELVVEWLPDGGEPTQSGAFFCTLLSPQYCLTLPGDADFNGDCFINGLDLATLLGAWGPCGPIFDCPADLMQDGAVNGSDLAILLGWWGQTPVCAP